MKELIPARRGETTIPVDGVGWEGMERASIEGARGGVGLKMISRFK